MLICPNSLPLFLKRREIVYNLTLHTQLPASQCKGCVCFTVVTCWQVQLTFVHNEMAQHSRAHKNAERRYRVKPDDQSSVKQRKGACKISSLLPKSRALGTLGETSPTSTLCSSVKRTYVNVQKASHVDCSKVASEKTRILGHMAKFSISGLPHTCIALKLSI